MEVPAPAFNGRESKISGGVRERKRGKKRKKKERKRKRINKKKRKKKVVHTLQIFFHKFQNES